MTNKSALIALFAVFLIGCKGNNQNENVCVEDSEWRDNNGPDSCSYYSENESVKS